MRHDGPAADRPGRQAADKVARERLSGRRGQLSSRHGHTVVEASGGDDPPRFPADHMAALAAKAAGAASGMVQLREDGFLRLLGGFRLPEGWEDLRLMPLGDTAGGIVVESGFPLVVDDVATDRRLPARALARQMGVGSYAGFPVRDPAGEVVGVCCVADGRARRWQPAELAAVDHAAQACTAFVAEQEARREADRHRRFLDAVLQNLRSGVAACDETGRVVLANAALRAMSPTDLAEFLVNASSRGLFHPDGRPMAPAEVPLARALAGERVRDAEVLARLPDAPPRLVLVDGQPITDGRGQRLGAVVTATDVTERRRVERFRDCQLAVTTALAGAATVSEAAPRVLEAVATTLGWPYAELWLADEQAGVLRPAARWSADPDRPPVPMPAELSPGAGLAGRSWAAGRPLVVTDLGGDAGRPSGDLSAELPGVAAREAGLRSAMAIPVRSGARTLGVLSVFSDVAERPPDAVTVLLNGIAAHIGQFVERRRAEELQLRLARTKDEYLALVGHELRTPLTSISAYAALLRDADPELFAHDGPELIRAIDRNAATLRAIVDDLLDLAALDSGHATVRRERTDLAQIVREAVAGAQPALAGTALRLTLDLPDALAVVGDQQRLRQVVDNLLGNAIKYTPEPGDIGVTLHAADGSTAELVVRDTGIGIPPDERALLFNRFYRSSRARNRSIPGTGLGLAVSQAIIARHGGEIALVPDGEPGTRIVVRLPLAR